MIIYLAVDARQELDLKVGVAFTRFQTRFFQGKYGNLDSPVISYGPCQTPTLSFCVERHDRIQSFQPEPFWAIVPTIQKDSQSIQLTWDRERLFDRNIAQLFLNSIESRNATVLSVDIKRKSKQRPHALNTVKKKTTGNFFFVVDISFILIKLSTMNLFVSSGEEEKGKNDANRIFFW